MKNLFFATLLMLMCAIPSTYAQKVTRVEKKTSSATTTKDISDYSYKIYKYDNQTFAAFTTSGKRITPNVEHIPLYCGGGIFKVRTHNKNNVFVGYNKEGKIVFPESLMCTQIYHCGDGIFKVEKQQKGVKIYAAYTVDGQCIIPFSKQYTFLFAYPQYSCFWVKDANENEFTYSLDGSAFSKGHLQLTNEKNIALFNNTKTIVREIKHTIKNKDNTESAKNSSFGQGQENTALNSLVKEMESNSKAKIITEDNYKWTLVWTNGFATLLDDSNNVVIPFSKGYNDIQFVKVYGHVGYFSTKKDGKYGACDIFGKEILFPRYSTVSYSPTNGFYCDNKPIKVWLDIRGKLCEKEFEDGFSEFVKGSPETKRELAVYPTIKGWGDVIKFNKYLENGIVWTDRISKSNGYTDIQLMRDGPYLPYYSHRDTINYYNYYVFKNKYVGVYDFYNTKRIISPDRGYTGITSVHIPNHACNDQLHYYLVTKGNLIGACDEKGKEIIAPVYTSLWYDATNGFVTLNPDGKKKSIGIFFTSKGKVYKSKVNLYQENVNYADKRMNGGYSYSSAIDSYSKALEYDQSAHAFYNYGVALYNNGDYRKAKKAFDHASYHATLEKNTELKDEAIRLYNKSEEMVKQRSQKRWETVAKIGMYTLAAAAAVAATAYSTPTYGTPTYGTPTSTYQYGDGGDAAIANANRIMQQSQARMQYEMATMPQRMMQQTAMQMAAQEAAKEAQWRQDYESYKKNPGFNLNEDGSLLSWEQYKQWRQQIEAQAWMESQQEQRGNTQESNSQPERKQRKHWQIQTDESSCTHCHGTGDCETCGGDGWMDAGFGLGVNNTKCTSCYDTPLRGKCQWCKGTKKKTTNKMVCE